MGPVCVGGGVRPWRLSENLKRSSLMILASAPDPICKWLENMFLIINKNPNCVHFQTELGKNTPLGPGPRSDSRNKGECKIAEGLFGPWQSLPTSPPHDAAILKLGLQIPRLPAQKATYQKS